MTSDTNSCTDVLRTLHRIHRQLNDLKGRLSRGPLLKKAHQASLEKLQQQFDQAHTEHHDLRIANDQKQLQLGSGEAAVKKRRFQLTRASDNREYQALKDQIAADEMTNSILADEILEGMEKLDELAGKVHAAETELAKGKADAEQACREIDAQEPSIQADMERLQAELKEVESSLPGEFKNLYQRLVRSRGEDALAMVEGHYCGGCNQQITINTINDLMLAKPLACLSCGRLLYLPEDYSPD